MSLMMFKLRRFSSSVAFPLLVEDDRTPRLEMLSRSGNDLCETLVLVPLAEKSDPHSVPLSDVTQGTDARVGVSFEQNLFEFCSRSDVRAAEKDARLRRFRVSLFFTDSEVKMDFNTFGMSSSHIS